MAQKKVIYIAGPITGVERYWEAFEKAEEDILALGCIPLSPSRLPVGLTDEQYMTISLATIDAADAVLFLKGWENSEGARVEMDYCTKFHKPAFKSLEQIMEVLR